ncbi:MAG: MCE family protein [Nitrospinae bacterium]|nr:MCE family protein [Nitrospinota bacterium]
MKLFTPETRVGFLTIFAGFALLYLSFKTAGVDIFSRGEYMKFNISFNSVAGLEERAKVKLSGVEIGYVEKIDLVDSKARITVSLTRDADIRADAIGTIRTSGLLGERYIEIVQGTKESPLLKTGEALTRSEDAAEISDMMAKMSSAVEDIKIITHSLRNTFGTEEGEQSLKNILHNIDSAAANMDLILAENRQALKVTMSNFSVISESFAKEAPSLAKNMEIVASGLKTLIEDNRANLTDGIANLKDVSGEFGGMLKENRENLKTTMDNLSRASAKIDSLMASVKNASSSIENVTSKIERGEGTVGKLVSDEQVYDNLNSALSGAKKLLNKADEVNLMVGIRSERQSELGQTKSHVSVKIQPREDKYYLLEATEDMRRTDISSTRNTINSLLYTLTMAKRFSDITIRAGLIESSAGAGADIHLFGDRVMASADLFNLSGYDKDAKNSQLKAQLRWNMQKYLFLYLGGDELLNEKYRSFLAGGGVMFDENDLKMALGLF